MTLTKLTADYTCNGCGKKETTSRKGAGYYGGRPKGWSRDSSGRSRTARRDLCAACTKAVAEAKRKALAARRKRVKK